MDKQTLGITFTVAAISMFVVSTSAMAEGSAPNPEETSGDASDLARLRQQEYQINHLGLFQDADASAESAESRSRWTLAYEGKDMKPLEGFAFYEKVGRSDLALAYQRKQGLKVGLTATGGIFFGLGVLFEVGALAAASSGGCSSSTYLGCVGSGIGAGAAGTAAFIGFGLIGVGTGLLAGGFVINPNPVGDAEARRLVDEYNQRLKERLGMSSELESTPEQREKVQIKVAPAISTSGGGLSLRVSF